MKSPLLSEAQDSEGAYWNTMPLRASVFGLEALAKHPMCRRIEAPTKTLKRSWGDKCMCGIAIGRGKAFDSRFPLFATDSQSVHSIIPDSRAQIRSEQGRRL